VKIYPNFVNGQAALAGNYVSKKIVRRAAPKGPFISRYEMGGRLEALFNETCFANWQNRRRRMPCLLKGTNLRGGRKSNMKCNVMEISPAVYRISTFHPEYGMTMHGSSFWGASREALFDLAKTLRETLGKPEISF
jgi:hypothetical protein